jgi:DNA polymerase-3 subunit delta
MTFEEIIKEIKSGVFRPVYFLHGAEPFFIDKIEEAIEQNALAEEERGFNQTILYGKEVDTLNLLDYLRRYPMMSERQVVLLREAQEMKGIADLAAYLEAPMETTVFVISYKHKKLDMKTKFGKLVKSKTVLFESKPLYDNQVPDWIAQYAKSKKLAMEPSATVLLAEYLGTKLDQVANELDKLALNLPAGTKVTPANVQEYVGISKEYNVYELQKAMAIRDLAKVGRIQQYFASNIKKNPVIVTIASLYSFFSKVYMLHYVKGKSDNEMVQTLGLRSEWFLRDYKVAMNNFSLSRTVHILSLLSEYDLRSKGINSDSTHTKEEELMKELFFRILH